MLTLVMPEDATQEQARKLALRHYGAVSRWLTVGEAVNAWGPLVKELVPGEGFMLDGRSHRMCWRQPAAGYAAAFEPTGHGVWLKVAPGLEADPDAATEAIKACYAREAAARVRERYGTYADRLDLGPLADVRTTDDGARWVSIRTTRRGLNITAHWALAQFGTCSVDYLLCRALCARAGRSIEAVFPGPYTRRDMQREARDVWTGEIACARAGF
jgi:hypothetical protein